MTVREDKPCARRLESREPMRMRSGGGGGGGGRLSIAKVCMGMYQIPSSRKRAIMYKQGLGGFYHKYETPMNSSIHVDSVD